MGRVELREVEDNDAGMRLDRWFRRNFPGVGHGYLEKLLRTGKIRVDGDRAKAGQRLSAGQRIRVPPIDVDVTTPPAPSVTPSDRAFIRSRILHQDQDIIVIDKPAGLAVQGGSKTHRHIDAMLDALRLDAVERPRLVHRLDRDTSGVLVLARTAAVARVLGQAFRSRKVRKIYWALVVGRPSGNQGRICVPLAKRGSAGNERMAPAIQRGKPALTEYTVVDSAGHTSAWLALMPSTGRTHQLRVHCAALGTPILGDGKYGRAAAFLPGVARRLHLHAREIAMTGLASGKDLVLRAPLPDELRNSWHHFGFDPGTGESANVSSQ